ncbi:MAG: hypothetical protein H0W85_01090 [Methylotenera sp.]|nr:hypothetical protein [Methylotenera sp.]
MQKIIKKFVLTLIYSLFLFTTVPAIADQGKVLTTSSGIKYFTGGIGEEEATAMRRMAKDFSLNLVFSEGGGGKITGVNAVIYNTQGEVVFRIKNANPMLYVNLPSGKYRVLANYGGEKQGYIFEVNATTNKKLILNWESNSNEEDYSKE